MGCADVCIDHDFDGYVEFYTERVIVARKDWYCVECGAEIGAGQRYEYASGKCEGDFFESRTCLLCVEIRKAFVCGSWEFGELWQSINEAIFPRWAEEGPWDCLAKLDTQEARDCIQQRYEEWRREE